jgi:TPR repeat protein
MLTAAQFLVDDAMQILSSLANNYESSDPSSSSVFVRLLSRVFDILKSLSFLQSPSQEEPVSFSDGRQTQVRKAMQLLTKAAESDNPEAMYLLGELNFVFTLAPGILTLVRELFIPRLPKIIQMVP